MTINSLILLRVAPHNCHTTLQHRTLQLCKMLLFCPTSQRCLILNTKASWHGVDKCSCL